jgi:hypothetical protein
MILAALYGALLRLKKSLCVSRRKELTRNFSTSEWMETCCVPPEWRRRLRIYGRRKREGESEGAGERERGRAGERARERNFEVRMMNFE